MPSGLGCLVLRYINHIRGSEGIRGSTRLSRVEPVFLGRWLVGIGGALAKISDCVVVSEAMWAAQVAEMAFTPEDRCLR